MERDSQVSASPDSLSLVSEPPDVRNWFSSYVYESPVLGIGEDFGDSVLSESEIRNLWRVFGNGRQKKVEVVHRFDDAGNVDLLVGDKKRELDIGRSFGSSGGNENEEESLTEAPDTSQSNLVASGNGSDGQGCVAATLDDGQKDLKAREEKTRVCTRSREELSSKLVKTDGSAEDHHRDKDEHSSEFAGYSTSSSLLSEPPHISNWFSSYVYESPELDTFRDFGCIENGCNVKADLLIGEMSNSKTETPSKLNQKKTNVYTSSKIIPSTIRSQREVNNELKENINLPFDVLVGENVTRVNSEYNAMALGDIIRSNSGLSLKGSGSCLGPEKEISRCPSESTYGRNRMKRLSGSNSQSDADSSVPTRDNPGLCTVNQASARTPNGRIFEKENLKPCSRSNGFVSIRKKAASALGPGSKPQEVVLDQCRQVKRTPLVETTNLPSQQDDAAESAGKWKCPQKSKPFVGPPMKQLRLERWVHRV